MAASTDLIDIGALKSLLNLIGGGTDDLAELLQDFLVIGPELLGQMRGALDNSDPKALHIAAHTLKSNAKDFGATALSEVCGSLEILAKTENLTDAQPLIEQVSALAQPSFDALSTYDLGDVARA